MYAIRSYYVFIGQGQMLRRRDIADQVGSVPAGLGGADGGSDMVKSGSHIGGNRAEHIIGSLPAHPLLQLDVAGNFIQRHMARALYEHLTPHVPPNLGQFTVDQQFLNLRPVGTRNNFV